MKSKDFTNEWLVGCETVASVKSQYLLAFNLYKCLDENKQFTELKNIEANSEPWSDYQLVPSIVSSQILELLHKFAHFKPGLSSQPAFNVDFCIYFRRVNIFLPASAFMIRNHWNRKKIVLQRLSNTCPSCISYFVPAIRYRKRSVEFNAPGKESIVYCPGINSFGTVRGSETMGRQTQKAFLRWNDGNANNGNELIIF